MKFRFIGLSVVLSIILLSSLISINFTCAQSPEEFTEGVQDTEQKIRTYSEQEYWGEKWDYLGQEWKTILLRNSIITSLDEFFRSISSVFFILFGLHYEMSLVLFFVIILWILVWNIADNWFKNSGLMPRYSAVVLSMLLVIGLSHLGIFSSIVIFIGRLVFSPESKWARLILGIGILFIFFLFQHLSHFFSKYLKAKREANEKQLERLNRTILGKFVKSFMEFSK